MGFCDLGHGPWLSKFEHCVVWQLAVLIRKSSSTGISQDLLHDKDRKQKHLMQAARLKGRRRMDSKSSDQSLLIMLVSGAPSYYIQ